MKQCSRVNAAIIAVGFILVTPSWVSGEEVSGATPKPLAEPPVDSVKAIPAKAKTAEQPKALSLRGPWRVMSIKVRDAEGKYIDLPDLDQLVHAGRSIYALIGKTTFILRIRDQSLVEATYTVDQSKTPAEINLKTKDGDMLGIFRGADNIIEIVLNDREDGRPTDFKQTGCDLHLSIRRFPNRNLLMCDCDGSKSKRLATETVFVRCNQQTWSPDGRKVAVQGTPREFEKDGDKSHVFVIDVASGKAKDLGPGAAPSWSADGKQIVFHTAERLFEQIPYSFAVHPRWDPLHVWVVNADGGKAKDLGPGGSPVWSPDGKWIAYCDTSKKATILMQPDGSGRKQIGPVASNYVWSPDGSELAYSTETNIGVYNIKNEKHRQLLDDRYSKIRCGISWSPDGKKITALARNTQGAFEIALIDAEGWEKGFQNLGPQNGDGNCFTDSICWDKDGKRILASLQINQSGKWLMCYLDPEGKLPVRVVDGQDTGVNHIRSVFSPDGSKIVWTEVVASSP